MVVINHAADVAWIIDPKLLAAPAIQMLRNVVLDRGAKVVAAQVPVEGNFSLMMSHHPTAPTNDHRSADLFSSNA